MVDDMKEYTLGFCTKDLDILQNEGNRQYWRCYADNEKHAIEQLKNAEPNVNWYEVIKVK